MTYYTLTYLSSCDSFSLVFIQVWPNSVSVKGIVNQEQPVQLSTWRLTVVQWQLSAMASELSQIVTLLFSLKLYFLLWVTKYPSLMIFRLWLFMNFTLFVIPWTFWKFVNMVGNQSKFMTLLNYYSLFVQPFLHLPTAYWFATMIALIQLSSLITHREWSWIRASLIANFR